MLHMARGETALKASNREGSETFEPGAKLRMPYILKIQRYIFLLCFHKRLLCHVRENNLPLIKQFPDLTLHHIVKTVI